MVSQPTTEEPATQPDWLLLTNGRLPDRGPPYTENQEYRIVGKTLTIRVLRVEEVGD